MKTKICLAITKGIWGGAQEYVYALATNLPKDAYDVVVVCGEGNTLQDKLTEAGIRCITIHSLKRDIFFWNDIRSFFAIRKILAKEQPDIFHLNSSKMGLLGSLAGRLAGVRKIIFTAHAWASNESRFSFIARTLFWHLHFLTIILSHHTIAVSNKTKTDIFTMPFANKKITVVYNGIDSIDFLTKLDARKEIRDMSRLAETTEVMIGTISELHKNKGLDLLVDGCIHLPDNASVYIIGDGEEKQNLQDKINAFKLEHKVFLVGRVPDARKYLKAFDIFTLTSRTEALPYSILEAGMAECAIIATRVGGIPEIIDHDTNGILINRNAQELESTLKRLIEDPEKRSLLGTHLHSKISNKFSLEQMIQKTISIYKKK